ncbi:MAG TPA: hypothetical protein ACHBZA_12130 [Arsenophonus apicola]|uniref:hypothetical protein n=1 Tax=Arsenophonus TaxID=637 RepID=UPI0015D725BD|nr:MULTISPECIES: hypothetical protein [Arsenophonus]UBX27845.1 hypothetical protein LDL57_08015 [Arsenophonus apicola]
MVKYLLLNYMNKRSNYLKLLVILLPLQVLAHDGQASLEQYPTKDIVAYFKQAQQEGLTGIAQKSKSVYARLATPGEIIKTIIKGVGTELISPPAQEGDWVVENICPATGNEQYLVEEAKFHQYYHDPVTVLGKPNYLRFIPTGKMMNYFIVPETESAFTFINSWGKKQLLRAGDIVIQPVSQPQNFYRVPKQSFLCTYNIVVTAQKTPKDLASN